MAFATDSFHTWDLSQSISHPDHIISVASRFHTWQPHMPYQRNMYAVLPNTLLSLSLYASGTRGNIPNKHAPKVVSYVTNVLP